MKDDLFIEPTDENIKVNYQKNTLLLFEIQNKFNNEIKTKIQKITDMNDTNLLLNLNNRLLIDINNKIDYSILFFSVSVISLGLLMLIKKN
jgi:hypothetical protein